MRMKRFIAILLLMFCFVMSVDAQNDGFFTSAYSEYREPESDWGVKMPRLPGTHGYQGDLSCDDVPVGDGLLLFALMGFCYMSRKAISLKTLFSKHTVSL